MTLRQMLRSSAESVLSFAPRRTVVGDRLILAYHNIVPAGFPPRGDASLHLPIDRFEAQLRHLRRAADVVALDDLLLTQEAKSRLVAITFDDAYASALSLGVPACLDQGIPCTVFIAPALLGCIPVWDAMAEHGRWSEDDRQRFLWEQRGVNMSDAALDGQLGMLPSTLRIATEADVLAVCRQPGVAVGNHSMNHANLGALSTAEARAELMAAGDWLNSRFPSTSAVVAYPYGIAPRDPASALGGTKLEHGLVVSGGWWRRGQDVSALTVPRWNVPAGITSRGFELRLRGWLTEA